MEKKSENNRLIRLTIFDIVLTEHGFTVILQSDLYSNKALQISVDIADAHLLTVQFNKVRTTKPLLVDVIQYFFDMLNIVPECAVIYSVQDNQFSTRVFLENENKKRFVVEVKTSDALAMMMAGGGDIFVDKILFESRALGYNFYEEKGEEETQQYKVIKLKDLQDKISIAIAEERYEDAALLRDEIRRLQGEGHV